MIRPWCLPASIDAPRLLHMSFRRFAGALTALLMLHLSLVASDAVCATHTTGHARNAQHQSAPGGESRADMSAQMAHHGAHDQRQRPCETPSQANCCQALASCGASFAASATRSLPPARANALVPSSVIDIPLSELAAPEPPPPKA